MKTIKEGDMKSLTAGFITIEYENETNVSPLPEENPEASVNKGAKNDIIPEEDAKNE